MHLLQKTQNAIVLPLLVLVLAAPIAWAAEPNDDGEILYNGIRLPASWPPRRGLTREPQPVPYLSHPPKVIPIDVGRQLFVDDFLIDETTLERIYHRAEPYSGNPVLGPDRPWEKATARATAMTFSDGVWYDPAEGVFKMWYMGAYCASTCYATSKDGLEWQKPPLDIEPGTNVVLRDTRDSSVVWLDLGEADPKRRYKMVYYGKSTPGKSNPCLILRVSADGVHWSDVVARNEVRSAPGANFGDRHTVFYNPFRKVWVYSLRVSSAFGRVRYYREHPDLAKGLDWTADEVVPWLCADRLDPFNPGRYAMDERDGRGNAVHDKANAQLYNFDAVAYESLMLGLFSIWQGDPAARGNQKRNEVMLGFSRDGFHFSRPDRRPFLGIDESDDAWNWGNVQSAGGGCLVVGDRLFFYHSGWRDRATGPISTGVAFLRRDGFASMDAGEVEGTLSTRPVRFDGKHLFVNVDAEDGRLQAEILDESARVIEPFTKANCLPVSTDKTLAAIKWNGAEDLSAVAGKPVRFRFYLKNGSLYAFWVSPDASGSSRGYVAAGGPGFTGPTDTVGKGDARN